MRYELPATPDRAIWDIWLSMHRLPAMAVADELGVFAALASAPATAEERKRGAAARVHDERGVVHDSLALARP